MNRAPVDRSRAYPERRPLLPLVTALFLAILADRRCLDTKQEGPFVATQFNSRQYGEVDSDCTA